MGGPTRLVPVPGHSCPMPLEFRSSSPTRRPRICNSDNRDEIRVQFLVE
jgi:hypothetical protein